MTPGQTMIRLFDRFVDALAVIGLAAILVMLVEICIDVAARALNLPGTAGGVMISEYSVYLLAFCGAPKVLRQNGHIHVDIVVTNVSASTARAMKVICELIALLVMATMTYYGVRMLANSYRDGTMLYKDLVIPEWTILWPIPLVTFCIVIEFAIRLLGGRKGHVSGPAMTGANL
jgi:TRAP-type C4-dicarboxylate transport system permease small subunit